MKHPALVMRGDAHGNVAFHITDEKGAILLKSRSFEDEAGLKKAINTIEDITRKAFDNIVDQLPSTIAHK